jgi:hypothetical protein
LARDLIIYEGTSVKECDAVQLLSDSRDVTLCLLLQGQLIPEKFNEYLVMTAPVFTGHRKIINEMDK